MGVTLLVGHAGHSWRDWLESNLRGSPLVVANPRDAAYGYPGRIAWFEDGKERGWRLVGNIDFLKNPVSWLAGALEFTWDYPAIYVLPEATNSALCRQVLLSFAQAVHPERIVLAEGSVAENWGWPVGPEIVPLSTDFPDMVREAQRRARWLELLENCEVHEVRLNEVAMMGVRLGSGVRAENEFGLGEVSGGVLHLVTREMLDDEMISRMLDEFHVSKVSLVHPRSYHGLICSFAHEDGEDFGMGVIKRFDEMRGVMEVLNTAVVPAPVRVMKVGTFRVDSKGKEIGEHNAWTV